jgi:hypothetical protein
MCVHSRRNNPYINYAAARGGATAGSNVKGCLMALILIAMFMVATLSSTSSVPAVDNKKTIRTGATKSSSSPQPNNNKPALHEFDMDQVGWVRPSDDDSASADDDGGTKRQRNDNPPIGDDDGSLSDSGDGMDYYDLDEFYRDADLLDAQAAVDEAAEQFYAAMQDELMSKENDIDEALEDKMTEIETDFKAVNEKQPQKFNAGEVNKLMETVKKALRDSVNKKIEELSSEMLDDINTDMEAAVDIDEEYEQEGSGDPIDLEAEQEELTTQVIQLTDEIVVEVLEVDLPEMAFTSLKSKLEESLRNQFKDKKFVVDVNKNDKKVTGWRDVTPTPPPTPAPTPAPTQPPTNKPTEAPKEETNEEKGGEPGAAEPEENKVEEEKEKEATDEAEGQ